MEVFTTELSGNAFDNQIKIDVTGRLVDMTPLVSILIPAYNAERWISDTIQSALDQTWKHKEIIIVDDGCKTTR